MNVGILLLSFYARDSLILTEASRILIVTLHYVKNEFYAILHFTCGNLVLFRPVYTTGKDTGPGRLFFHPGFRRADRECEDGGDHDAERQIPCVDEAVWE